ncbi:nitroreductase family protein, partial [Phocaeicola coprophilus]
MNREFLELIKTRRSCRKYKPEQITDEELQAVLEAGTYAPTSRG